MGQIIGVTLLALTMLNASSSMAQMEKEQRAAMYAETSDDEKKMYVSDAISEMSDGIKQVERL